MTLLLAREVVIYHQVLLVHQALQSWVGPHLLLNNFLLRCLPQLRSFST